MAEAKAAIRSEMRARRAALAPGDLAEASAALVMRLESLPVIARASRVAVYRAVRGEIGLDALFDGERRAAFTLPRVSGPDLEFVARAEGWQLAPGAFGIPEPVEGETVPLADHDVVLVPLVAFDATCHRVGQGGGFYDRALASLASPTSPASAGAGSGPVAVGVAHWFQQVDRVPREPWDVPLDAVVTDRSVIVAAGGPLA